MKKFLGVLQYFISCTYFWLLYIRFSKNKKAGRLELKRNILIKIVYLVENYILDKNKIFIKGSMEKSEENNKIDILLANHNSTIDFMFIGYICKKNNINNIYFIIKDSITKIPVIGDCLRDDISLKRNWEEDKENLINQLNEIESGMIIIYPEGTRFDIDKYKKSKKFCYDNKLPILNYTLTPRVKGTHAICKTLFEKNRLGNIYDTTLYFKDHSKTNLYLSRIFTMSDLGELDINIKKFGFSEEDLDYEIFKNKMYDLWFKKNLYIDTLLPKKKIRNEDKFKK